MFLDVGLIVLADLVEPADQRVLNLAVFNVDVHDRCIGLYGQLVYFIQLWILFLPVRLIHVVRIDLALSGIAFSLTTVKPAIFLMYGCL
jgi:hypothetical protein